MSTDLAILDTFISDHPEDAVRILEQWDVETSASLLAEIPAHLTIALFNRMEPFTAVRCLEILGPEQAASIIEKLPLQVVLNLLRQARPAFREEILTLINQDFSILLKKQMQYHEGSAGALADPFVLTLPEDITIKQALENVNHRRDKVIYYIYILNRDYVLTGVINLRDMMLSKPALQLSEVMQSKVTTISPLLSYPAILSHPGWQKYHTLPVVEHSGVFLGAIRYESLRQIEREIKKSQLSHHAFAAGTALGELYQIGITGLIRSANPIAKSDQE